MSYSPSSSFHNAATYLSSTSSLSQVSSSTKLELYGLFKYISSSTAPPSPRPSLFDVFGRAKWDSWNATAKKYENVKDAESRYIELARGLGWTEATVQYKGDADDAVAAEIWDTGRSSIQGSSGLGLFVSSMPEPPKVLDKSIHGFALSNDISGFTTLLDEYPGTNLNALDEFGYAPLHLACDRGNTEMVKFLVSRGADKTIKDPDNLTALELAKEAGHSDIENILIT